MRPLTWSVVLLTCVFLTGCAHSGGKLAGNGAVHPDVLSKVGLRYYWDLPIELQPNERIVRLRLMDENIYCITNINRIIAIDAAAGKYKWSYDGVQANDTLFPLTHANDLNLTPHPSSVGQMIGAERKEYLPRFNGVLFCTLGEGFVLNRETGQVVRRYELGFSASSGGAANTIEFFVGAMNGWVNAIDLQAAKKNWSLATRTIITAPLRYYNGYIYIGGEDNAFRAVKAGQQEGKLFWSQPLRGPVVAAFHVDERGCFIPCESNLIYAFDLFGNQLWMPFNCQGPLRDPIQVGDHTIFQVARRDKFYAINLVTGKQRWTLPDGQRVLANFDGNVYVLTTDRHLTVVDEMLGTHKFSVGLTGMDVFADNTQSKAIYAARSDGHLYCIRPASAGYLGQKKPQTEPTDDMNVD